MTIFQYMFGAWILASTLCPCQTQAAQAVILKPPSDLVARSFSADQVNFWINLSWTDATPNESSFRLLFSTNARFTTPTALTIPANRTQYLHTGLTGSTTYWYKIQAITTTPPAASPYSNTAAAVAGTPIAPLFFGQNAWMPDKVGDENRGGDLEKLLCGVDYDPGDACVPAEVQASGVKLMRYGGTTVDNHYVSDTEATSEDLKSSVQYLAMVENMRDNGIEPLLEVPYGGDPDGAGADGPYDVQIAEDLVRHINITNSKSVKYWTIGNEPDKYAGGTTANAIATYFKAFAMRMRDVDPNIAIVGPDLSYYDYQPAGAVSTVMDELTEPNGANDICGRDPGTGRYYLDIIDFHTYPFGVGARTRADIIAKPQGDFQDDLIALKGRVHDCNTTHLRSSNVGAQALKIAVTETNLEYQDQFACDPAVPGDCDLSPEGLNGQSFLAGQYWADMMNVGMKHGLEFIAFWSIKERDPPRGYIAGDNNTKLSTYYHYQMLAQNFRGVYAAGTPLVNGAPTNNVKAFGAKDVDQIVVMLLNESKNPTPPGLPLPLSYTVRLNTGNVTGNSFLKVNIDAGVAGVAQYSVSSAEGLAPESTVMLVFNDRGTFLRRYVYKLSNAQSNTEPLCTGDC